MEQHPPLLYRRRERLVLVELKQETDFIERGMVRGRPVATAFHLGPHAQAILEVKSPLVRAAGAGDEHHILVPGACPIAPLLVEFLGELCRSHRSALPPPAALPTGFYQIQADPSPGTL